jgi:hypothetical protein
MQLEVIDVSEMLISNLTHQLGFSALRKDSPQHHNPSHNKIE